MSGWYHEAAFQSHFTLNARTRGWHMSQKDRIMTFVNYHTFVARSSSRPNACSLDIRCRPFHSSLLRINEAVLTRHSCTWNTEDSIHRFQAQTLVLTAARFDEMADCFFFVIGIPLLSLLFGKGKEKVAGGQVLRAASRCATASTIYTR